MRNSPSILKRVLEPLASGLWIFFIVTTLAVSVLWVFKVGDARVAKWVVNKDLAQALYWIMQRLDLLWFSLAAANGYLCLTKREGIAITRQWSILVLIVVTVVGWISARTGYLLGPIQFGTTLGTRLGPVPVGLLLFWFSVIVGAREGLLRLFPRWAHWQIAAGTGFLALLTDVSLEPLATNLRGFWTWRAPVPGDPPVFDSPATTCVVWGVTAFAIAFVMRDKNVVHSTQTRSWQPAAALFIFNLVFLGSHVAKWASRN